MYDSTVAPGFGLLPQTITLLTVIATAVFWIVVYTKTGRKNLLKLVWPPTSLWLVFGTLDITATAKAVYLNPYYEANPLARLLFINLGFLGPPAAAFLWISLWAVISILMDVGLKNLSKPINAFTQLTLFYSLAVGHFFAYSGWTSWGQEIYYYGFTINQQNPILNHMLFGIFYTTWILIAATAALIHLTIIKIARKSNPPK